MQGERKAETLGEGPGKPGKRRGRIAGGAEAETPGKGPGKVGGGGGRIAGERRTETPGRALRRGGGRVGAGVYWCCMRSKMPSANLRRSAEKSRTSLTPFSK